jgi:hypothetical protein
MNREMQVRHLEEAERHVVLGERHIADQERRVAELDRGGHDTTDARRLLDNFRTLQEQHIEHRNRLLRELEP